MTSKKNLYDNDPNFYVLKYFKLSLQFQEIKKYLKSHTENYFDYLSHFMGMKMPSMIKNPNFYHFCSESWILTIFETLIIKKIKKIETFKDLIETIKNLKIEENKFSENLEILLGTYKLQEHIIKITQLKLSLLFLKKISQSLDETIPKNLPDDISQEKFEDLIFLTLVKAVNYTLNELSTTIDNKNSLLFLNIFTELNHDQKLKSENFVEEVLKYHKLSEEEISKKIQNYSNLEIELMNPSTVFYYFAKTDLRKLTKDLQAFIYNSADILTKLKLSLRQKFLRVKNYLRFAGDLLDNYADSLRLKLAIDYIIMAFTYVNIIKDRTILAFKRNYNSLKTWIDSSSIGNINRYVYERTKYLMNLVMYKGIIFPMKYLIIDNTYNLLRVFILTMSLTRGMVDMLKSLIVTGFVSILGEGPYIKFSEKENEEYVCFEINKELIPTSNTKIRELIEFVEEQLRKFNLFQLIVVCKIQTSKVKNLVYKKFRSVLNIGEAVNDENKSSQIKCKSE